MPGKSLNGKADYELKLFLRKAFENKQGEISKNGRENGFCGV